jgi:hypothetical protein
MILIHIILDLSLLQIDVPPLIDIPTMEISSTLLLDLMNSPCGAFCLLDLARCTYGGVYFAYWTLHGRSL